MKRRSSRLLVGGLVAAAVALGLAVALTRGGDAAAAPLGYVGRVDGTRAFVAVVVRGTSATAYVCDGRKLAQWFSGSVHDGRALLRSATGGRLELRLSDVARGTLSIPGREAASFEAVAAHGTAGLFRSDRAVTRGGRTERVLTGWVRLNDGSMRGAGVTSPFRIVHSAAGVDAVLLAAPAGTVGPPAGVPTLELRTTALEPVCEQVKGFARDGKKVFLTTRGCGLPQAGAKPAGGAAVQLRPRDFRLSAGALAAFAGGLGRLTADRRQAMFKRAGQREPIGFSASARKRIESEAAAMVQDSKVLDAADQLRRAPANSLLERMESYRRAAQGHTDRLGVIQTDGNPLVGIYTVGGLRPLRLPVVQDYTGPWAAVSDLETDGDQWEIADGADTICHDLACVPLSRVLAGATNVEAQARAGFNSSVTYDRANLLTFDVPPGSGKVEVDIVAGDIKVDMDTQDCFGIAWGWAGWSYAIFRLGDDGSVDVLDDPEVTAIVGANFYDPDDAELKRDDCVSFTPPIPDPPQYDVLATGPDVLTFTAPPEGGTYVLAAMVEAHAEVSLGGTAVAQAAVGVEKVTVSHH